MAYDVYIRARNAPPAATTSAEVQSLSAQVTALTQMVANLANQSSNNNEEPSGS